MAIKFTQHPGSGYEYVLCDICGGKFRRKDTVYVQERYNYQNGLVVCKDDVDLINEQSLPNTKHDRPIPHPHTLRPEGEDTFAVNENDDRVPGAPRNVSAVASTIDSSIELFWEGPFDAGSSGITGYLIKIADPQLSVYTTLEANTNSCSPYYDDTVSAVSGEYSYTVAAINSFGTGPDSEPAFYPALNVERSVNYLLVSQDDSFLTTGDDLNIIL